MKKIIMEENHWTDDDEKYFFERYELLKEEDKPYCLLNKAQELLFQFGSSKADAATRLLAEFFENFPSLKGPKQIKDEDTEESENTDNIDIQKNWDYLHPLALLLQGKIYLTNKDYNNCFECYCQAAEIEEKMELNFEGWLVFAEFVVIYKKTEFYDKAEKYLLSHYDTKDFDTDVVINKLFAKIAEYKQDFSKQQYYANIADNMLKDAAKDFKPLYYNVVKLSNLESGLAENIENFLKSKKFTKEKDTNPFGWTRDGFACKQHLIFMRLFDVIVIKAFIYFNDIVTGQPQAMGLDGFIAMIGKLPLKKIVKQLEKMITNQRL